MFEEPLPRQADVRKWAARGLNLQARHPIADMPRLRSALCDGEGVAEVALQFSTDAEKHRLIDLQMSATVSVLCQRCLQPMTVTLTSESTLAIVWSEDDAAHLPKSLEPLVAGELVNLAELVEDELILTLPIVNFHEPEDCGKASGYVSADPEQLGKKENPPAGAPGDGRDERENPFKVLEQLKSGK